MLIFNLIKTKILFKRILKIAVFVSGRGSNLQAILDYRQKIKPIKVEAVVSDKMNCPAFEIAKRNSISVFSVGSREGYVSYDQLSSLLLDLGIELIVLAGFLKLIPVDFVRRFENKMINIHPALLPSFGGKGMYGINVHQAVFKSSAKVSGATVHLVDPDYDSGKIVAQRCVDISDVKSPEEIAERVLSIEHEILPYVVGKFAEGKVKVINERVVIFD